MCKALYTIAIYVYVYTNVYLNKVDGNDASLALRVLSKVPEDDVAGLQHCQLVTLGEWQVMWVLGWGERGGDSVVHTHTHTHTPKRG